MAAPIQRSSALLHVTAPLSSKWKIDATQISITSTADSMEVKNESAEENGQISLLARVLERSQLVL